MTDQTRKLADPIVLDNDPRTDPESVQLMKNGEAFDRKTDDRSHPAERKLERTNGRFRAETECACRKADSVREDALRTLHLAANCVISTLEKGH